MVGLIKVCVNGARKREAHPALPVTGAELAAAVAAAVAAGARAAHLHPRGDDGEESLWPEHVGAAVKAVRERSPGIPIGVSTGLWMTAGDFRRRRSLVGRWRDLPTSARPDFASVNVGEPGFAELVDTLHDAEIAVEAGVWSVADADTLAATGRGGDVMRVLVEIIDATAAAAGRTADQIIGRLDQHAVQAPRLLHGEGATCWCLVRYAGSLELATRIGLEDTLTGPDGTPVRDNAALVRQALVEWERGHQAGLGC